MNDVRIYSCLLAVALSTVWLAISKLGSFNGPLTWIPIGFCFSLWLIFALIVTLVVKVSGD